MEKKKWHKNIADFFCRYVNGTKGAVSLLLAIAVSPLLSVALLLVESARYQSAVEQIKELANSSAFSTLADYDGYLEERFGLFALDQEEDVENNFDSYLDYNTDAIGKGLTVTDSTAEGKFALSNTDTLKQQIKEFGELTVTSEIFIEGFDIKELIDKLVDNLKLKDLKKEIETVEAGMDVATEVEKIIESLATLKTDYDAYSKALTEYRDAYAKLEEKGVKLIEELQDAEKKLKDDESYDEIYNKWGVKNAVKDAKEAASKYKEKAEALKEKLSTLNKNVSTLQSAAEKLPEKLRKLEEKTRDSKISTISSFDWITAAVQQIIQKLNGAVPKDRVNNEIKALETQITLLGQFGDKTITSSWDSAKIKEQYGTVTISAITSRFTTLIDNLIASLDEKAQVNDKQNADMGDLLTLAQELLKIQLIFDPSLNSNISNSVLYTTDVGMSLSDKALITSINLLLSACENFRESIDGLNFLKALEAVVELMGAIVTFLGAIVTWAEGLLNALNNGMTDLVGNFITFGYGVYNVPNRTNCTDGKALTGYSYSTLFTKAGGSWDDYGGKAGKLSDLQNQSNTAGTDTMFKGAVGEYLLVGANSEKLNQSCTFLKLYLLRLVLDVFHVMNSNFVNTIALTAGPGAFLVKFCFVLIEPFLDCMFLVNGVSQYIWKKHSYFEYQGLVQLGNDIAQMLQNGGVISGNVKSIIDKQIKYANGTPDMVGYCSSGYTEHLLLLMLTVPNQSYMNRLKNVIQMEGKAQDEDFKLSKTYTYVYTEVSYTLNPMFNIKGLTDGAAFTGKTVQYAGY